MPKFLISLFTELASVIGGGVAGSLNLVVNIMQKGFGAAMQFHQEGIALARDLGLSASQAQAYTQALTESTIKLANKYGVTADAIKAVQRGISESTNRQLLLNDAQREQLVIANKLVGAQTTNQFTAEIMNHLGGQVSTVEGAISKAYATASKQGLNAQKFSATVAKNLSMANKLSFRDGVNGIIRMTALSEKLGFNLQSVESAANKFMDLDSAIESSAQLQMLGGAAGAYGSNPLTMAYEANYDPETFTERMTKMLGGYAQFDTKTGMANVNGMNRDFVKNIAQAMGISMDEAMTIAKKNAEVKFKESQFSTQLTNRFGNDEATKNYILNNSTYNTETRQLELNGRDISEYKDEEIAELKRMASMSDHDLMVEQAQALTSLPEKIEGAASQVAASFASGIERYIPDLRNQIGIIGDFLSGHAKNWGQSVGQALSSTLQWLETKGPKILDTTDKIFRGIDKLISSIGPIINWVLENPWKSLFAFIAGKAALNSLTNNPSIGAKAAKGTWSGVKWLGGKVLQGGKAVGRGAWKGLKIGAKGFWDVAKMAAKGAWKGLKVGAKGFWSVAETAAKGAWKGLKLGAKGAKWLGGKSLQAAKSVKGGAAILGVASNMATDYLVDKGKIKKGGAIHYGAKMASTAAEYGALGATIGSIIPGLGTAVGGGIGAAVGAIKGAYDTWKSLPENADKDFIDYAKSVGNSIVEGGKEAFNWAKEKVGLALSSVNKEIQERGGYLSVAFNLITTPIRLFINTLEGIAKFIVHPVDTIKNIWDKLTSWLSGDNVLGKLFNKAVDAIIGEKHANGGIVGGNSYSGDRILTSLNSGEMVLNKNQQSALFNFINEMPSVLSKISANGIQTDLFRGIGSIFSSIVSPLSVLKNSNDVKAKPVGEKEYVYTPTSDNRGNGVTELTVKDINVNVNGTLKLDAGNFTKNIDINQLLNDSSFVSQLKDLIKESINNDINNGRFMNDIASMRGMPSQVGLWGRK